MSSVATSRQTCFCVAVLWNGAVVTGAGVITAPSSASVEDIRRQTAEMATIDARSKVRAILSSERFGRWWMRLQIVSEANDEWHPWRRRSSHVRWSAAVAPANRVCVVTSPGRCSTSTTSRRFVRGVAATHTGRADATGQWQAGLAICLSSLWKYIDHRGNLTSRQQRFEAARGRADGFRRSRQKRRGAAQHHRRDGRQAGGSAAHEAASDGYTGHAGHLNPHGRTNRQGPKHR